MFETRDPLFDACGLFLACEAVFLMHSIYGSFFARTRGQEAVFLCLKHVIACASPGHSDWLITRLP